MPFLVCAPVRMTVHLLYTVLTLLALNRAVTPKSPLYTYTCDAPPNIT